MNGYEKGGVIRDERKSVETGRISAKRADRGWIGDRAL